jgi:hypothetical protein
MGRPKSEEWAVYRPDDAGNRSARWTADGQTRDDNRVSEQTNAATGPCVLPHSRLGVGFGHNLKGQAMSEYHTDRQTAGSFARPGHQP